MTDGVRPDEQPKPAYVDRRAQRPVPSLIPPDEERDFSLLHYGKVRREKRQAKRRRQQTFVAAIVTGVAVIAVATALGFAVRAVIGAKGSTASAKPSGMTWQPWAKKTMVDIAKLGKPVLPPEPTPIFASWGNLKIHLPVPPKKLIELGFHQASYSYSLHMDTTLKMADDTKTRKLRTTGGHKVVKDGDGTRLTGYYIRMWRARPGTPDSAADVGAAPGTPVIAPVSGKVVRVRHYKLYGRLADWEVHIRPDDNSRVDVVVIHIDKVKVPIGAHVVGGVTQIAEVRKISGIIDSQLKEFTRTGGDHTHIQLNDTWRRDYKGLREPDAPGLAPYEGPE